mmetsp:Transcript_25132/g.41869  ORF Transcript_25132/g.41869 Transcript_25132/m.41869 type:complete len:122 (+) Transcript_25132:88-453(+)|eukprot:CAMPEP_0174975372 /NCGR_PEP_ID=MMETSP0004_2-20121128/12402_1 /TAXON_ID=420556 /ORGANISM="Ochromonas sp., Strain CCMP1393" /LENGTH=121 /DNA_ID=CAMNT_0016226207 /DNA_START=82 /DNA_END=447 /DNA_ORIENTATION=+
MLRAVGLNAVKRVHAARSGSMSLPTVSRRGFEGITFPNCIARGMVVDATSPYEHGKHRSNAEELVNSVPVIEVAGHVAVCDGGSGALGHPIEYIQLDTVSSKPAVCKYCGLRYKMKEGSHH